MDIAMKTDAMVGIAVEIFVVGLRIFSPKIRIIMFLSFMQMTHYSFSIPHYFQLSTLYCFDFAD